ncbi:hypothetical protein HUU40_25565, partial [candidate division KSB1 bacterium]|nr:hypothetical protein [candidate division KSB1 bacterium]
DLGMTPAGAVVFIYLVATTIGIAAALLPYLPLWGEILVLIHTVLIYVMITTLVHVAKHRRQTILEQKSTTVKAAGLE